MFMEQAPVAGVRFLHAMNSSRTRCVVSSDPHRASPLPIAHARERRAGAPLFRFTRFHGREGEGVKETQVGDSTPRWFLDRSFAGKAFAVCETCNCLPLTIRRDGSPAQSFAPGLGGTIPTDFIRDASVVGFSPSTSAAPPGPET